MGVLFMFFFLFKAQKIYSQLNPHNHEKRSRINNKMIIPRYSKSKCQNALISRCKKMWNTTPDDIKQSANLADKCVRETTTAHETQAWDTSLKSSQHGSFTSSMCI